MAPSAGKKTKVKGRKNGNNGRDEGVGTSAGTSTGEVAQLVGTLGNLEKERTALLAERQAELERVLSRHDDLVSRGLLSCLLTGFERTG